MANDSPLKDYTVLPILFPPLPSFPHASTHYLYLRPHSPKTPTPNAPRTLFVANVPIDSTPAHLRAVFTSPNLLEPTSTARPSIESVDFPALPPPKTSSARGKKRKRNETYTNAQGEAVARDPLALPFPSTYDRTIHASGAAALIVFHDRRAMLSCFAAVKAYASLDKDSRDDITWGKNLPSEPPQLGSSRYKTHLALSRPSHQLLQDRVDSYMLNLSAHEAHVARLRAKALMQPDDDGFVTVTRGARTGPARSEEAAQALQDMRAKEARRKEEMGDFYRFQTRERRKEREQQLKTGFEDDIARAKALARRKGLTPMG